MFHDAFAHASAPPDSWDDLAEIIREGRAIVEAEANALARVATRLDDAFAVAVKLLLKTRGSAIVSGIGKAGLVGQKIAATLASTGTRSHFLHPAEAVHGDLGRIHQDDIVIMLSQSGETAEVTQLLAPLAARAIPIIAITGRKTSAVGRAAAATIELGQLDEACALGLAPSTSTTAMLAVGDALALVVSRLRGFQAEDFATFHPGGSLGKKLSRVDAQMRPIHECRIAEESKTVREVVVACSRPGRRTGAIMLVNARGELTGMFTDSDLARLFEQRNENALDRPIRDVMTKNPATTASGSLLLEAIEQMAGRKISELPVVAPDGRPIGLLDVTDILDAPEKSPQSAPRVPSAAETPAAIKIFAPPANPG